MPCTFGSTCTTHGQGALHGAASASFAMVGHVVGWFKPKSIHISCTCSDGGWSGLVETRGVPLHGRLFSFLHLGSCSDALAVHRFQSHDASSIVCMDGELRLAPFFLVVLSMYVSMQPAMHTVRPTLHRREETLLWGRDPNPPARQNPCFLDSFLPFLFFFFVALVCVGLVWLRRCFVVSQPRWKTSAHVVACHNLRE